MRHNFGAALLQSYRQDANDEGIVIPKKLRFLDASGSSLEGGTMGMILRTGGRLWMPALSQYVDLQDQTYLRIGASTSLHDPAGSACYSLIIGSEATTFRFEKPVEAKVYVGIENSYTRLTDGYLLLNNTTGLRGGSDGITHLGNAYMTGNVSSELFSSGFAGSGWAIQRNKNTGNTTATFDDLTVRKRMRVYELEIERSAATNGALWITDSFCGDTVTRIY